MDWLRSNFWAGLLNFYKGGDVYKRQQKTVTIANGSSEVMKSAQDAENSAAELRKNVNNFKIDEQAE